MASPTAWNIDDLSSHLSVDPSGIRVNYIGYYKGSWGYHGDDGKIFYERVYRSYGPLFTTGDTIGCCINFKHKTAFYTKNGVHLAMTADDIKLRYLKDEWINSFALYSKGSINQRIKKFEDSLTTLEIRKKNKVHTLGYRGKVYFIIGKYEHALNDFTNLLKIDSNNLFALRYRSEIYNIMKRRNESLEDLNRILEIKANDAWALKAKEEVSNE
ncbi:hypothetical protein C2G38_2030482 [Gigaspora rosea]|uniref:B30.2/SPRY domain-containing protein n=1 Tax=Gigaspora rosea TaxID=44941 RepID=A0A397VWI8_9GLOM|nr:hypothetical protein C2G38_2030482 [Gigaspora rosea]